MANKVLTKVDNMLSRLLHTTSNEELEQMTKDMMQRHEAFLNSPSYDGRTMREHIEERKKKKAKIEEILPHALSTRIRVWLPGYQEYSYPLLAITGDQTLADILIGLSDDEIEALAKGEP